MNTITAFLMLLPPAFAWADAPKPLTVTFGDGPVLELQTQSTTGKSLRSSGGSVEVGKGHDAHRFVLDKDDKIIFGYYIEARRAGRGTFVLRMKPFDREKIRQESGYLRQNGAAEVPTLASAREFPALRPGDAVQIDILQNPATGEKIYDVLKVSAGPAAARIPDGAKFSLYSFRVDLNGATIRERREMQMIGGALMVYLPGRGDFYLSLSQPRELPSRPAGWVDHNVLRFFAGADLVEVVCAANALVHSDYGTLWVYHDPKSAGREAAVERIRQKLEELRKTHKSIRELEVQADKRPGVEFTCGDDVESLVHMKNKSD